MSAATQPPSVEAKLTVEEFLARHGDETRVDLVDGTVVRYPMPGSLHGAVSCNAATIVNVFVRSQSLGRVFSHDTFVRVGKGRESLRGADVAFLSYARFPMALPSPEGPLPASPELVVEVRSPTDRTGDIMVKVGEYLSAGVTAVVVLDPRLESATVYREGDELPWRFHNGDELTLPDVLPGFAVPVRQFFE